MEKIPLPTPKGSVIYHNRNNKKTAHPIQLLRLEYEVLNFKFELYVNNKKEKRRRYQQDVETL